MVDEPETVPETSIALLIERFHKYPPAGLVNLLHSPADGS
jgi:hypothetical protein